MKKFLLIILWTCLFNFGKSNAVNINGNAFLQGQSIHDSIKIVFNRIVPSPFDDSTYTNSAGVYSIVLPQGIYNISYSKSNYFPVYGTNEILYADTTLSDTTLEQHTSIISVPFSMPTIQGAIDIAFNGDTILVEPGIYYEHIKFRGKGITVASEYLLNNDTSYISNTIIHGSDSGDVVSFINNEPPNATINGFTITHGVHGIYCLLANATISNLEITNNTITTVSNDEGGAGIKFIYYSKITVTNCNIHNNYINSPSGSYSGGPAVFTRYYSSGVFTGVRIFNNVNMNTTGWGSLCGGGGVYAQAWDTLQFINCEISHNTVTSLGGGMATFDGVTLSLKNTLITNNSSETGGGGIYYENGTTKCYNSTISNNHGDGIFGIGNLHLEIVNSNVTFNKGYGYKQDVSGGTGIVNSNFWQNDSGNYFNMNPWIGINLTQNINNDSCDAFNNIHLNPIYADTSNGNFHLLVNSPCIDAGINDSVTYSTDLDNSPRIIIGNSLNSIPYVDIGPYEFDSTALTIFDSDIGVNQITICPNPFTSEIKIINSKRGEVIFYDITGKEILHQITLEGETNLNTEKILSGFYLLHYSDRIMTANFKVTKK